MSLLVITTVHASPEGVKALVERLSEVVGKEVKTSEMLKVGTSENVELHPLNLGIGGTFKNESPTLPSPRGMVVEEGRVIFYD